MKRWLIPGLMLCFFGCSGNNDIRQKVDEDHAALAKLEQRITNLENQMDALPNFGKMEARQLQAMDALKNESNLRDSGLRNSVDELNLRLGKIERQRASLDMPPAVVAAKTAASTPRPGPRVSVYTASDRPADVIATPAGDNFPLRVFGVAGRKVATGTYTSTQYIETDKTYRDGFGAITKQKQPVGVEMTNYGYEVSFAVANMGPTKQEINVSAGSESKALVLFPGEFITNGSVPSAVGADLRVTTSGQTRNFPVSY